MDVDAIDRRWQSASMGGLRTLVGNNDGKVYTKTDALLADCQGHEARAEFISRLAEDMPALIAAARLAQRYEAALRDIYDDVRVAAKSQFDAGNLQEEVEWVRDTVHAAVWGNSPPTTQPDESAG